MQNLFKLINELDNRNRKVYGDKTAAMLFVVSLFCVMAVMGMIGAVALIGILWIIYENWPFFAALAAAAAIGIVGASINAWIRGAAN